MINVDFVGIVHFADKFYTDLIAATNPELYFDMELFKKLCLINFISD